MLNPITNIYFSLLKFNIIILIVENRKVFQVVGLANLKLVIPFN